MTERKIAIYQSPAGEWILAAGGDVLATCATHRQAWREYDRLMNAPMSRSEATADWVFRKSLDA